MQPHQARVILERKKLDIKRRSLAAFLITDGFTSLNLNDQMLLNFQFNIMSAYSVILAMRIAAFYSRA